MSKIYIFKYNNYFNRIIKKETSLANYGTPLYTLNATNFNYSDGVTTNHVCNYNGEGDYCIVCDNNNNIESHWFIIHPDKTRGGQHNLQLRRDLIVDFYNNIITAPMIVGRAMINNPDNPLLFNPEGFSFNQIKRQEYFLNDESQARWYYLYFKKDMSEKSISVIMSNNGYDTTISGTVGTFFPTSGVTQKCISINSMELRAIVDYDNTPGSSYIYYNADWYCYDSSNVDYDYYTTSTRAYHKIWFDDPFNSINTAVSNMLKANYTDLTTTYKSEAGSTISENDYYTWLAYNGKKVKDSSNKIYQISVVSSETTVNEFIEDYSNTWAKYKTMIDNSNIDYTDGYGTEALQMNTTVRTITVTYVDVTDKSGTATFKLFDNNADYISTQDCDYKIIAIPYDSIDYVKNNTHFSTNINDSQKIVKQIMLSCTTEELVDIQLLPYCPYQSVLNNGSVYPETNISNKQYQFINHTETIEQLTVTIQDSLIFYIDKANFSFNINKTLNIGNYDTNVALNKKIANEVEVWRLVSPNYNGTFEFSLAKNDGIDYFNVDITLKPYNPYIHLNPNFKSLYGLDFDDARGLILEGDFSLPRETTAWAEYELRNKNYQIAFNRQIEHMDFQFGQERVLAGISALTGTISGAATGATAGAMAGGGVGAAVGGAIGGITSLAGGIADLSMMGARQREDKDYVVDNFTYQLGNIKALPNSITKVTPLTYNNKKFPFLEKYVATDTEIEILKNKILYTSMNINAIGSILEYLQPTRTFIQGTLIRLEDTGLASHEVNEIYNELMKGVYI